MTGNTICIIFCLKELVESCIRQTLHILFYLRERDPKYFIPTGYYSDLNVTTEQEVNIFREIKGPSASIQNLKAVLHRVVVYEVAELKLPNFPLLLGRDNNGHLGVV